MLKLARTGLSSLRHWWTLPRQAEVETKRDRRDSLPKDPGINRCVDEALGWLIRAQDLSASADGGVARHFSLIDGWSTSYPETTGYIIPTILDLAYNLRREDLRDRAHRMLDWLVSIQLPEGAFQGGPIGVKPVVPAVFDTGQILIGLAAGVREYGEDRYLDALMRAANWLRRAQAPDGSWPQETAPFALTGPKAYETHVAWGLMEAARAAGDQRFLDAALANVRWAMSLQQENGWFGRCCLTDPAQPLTHTIGYALRGIVEAYRTTRAPEFLDSAQRCANGILLALRDDGSLPGRIDSRWNGTVPWVCLTGNVQVAICWLILYQETANADYRDAGMRADRFVRRTVRIDGPDGMRGGVKGSFPVDGAYGRYQYLNWACKFLIDANLLERDLNGHCRNGVAPEERGGNAN